MMRWVFLLFMALLVVPPWAPVALGQRIGGETRTITLVPSMTLATANFSAGVAVVPITAASLAHVRRGTCGLIPTAFATTGTATTDVLIQNQPDGTTWQDWARFGRQITSGQPRKSYVGFSFDGVPGLGEVTGANDGNVTTGLAEFATKAPFPIGAVPRVKVVTSATTIAFTFSIVCVVQD